MKKALLQASISGITMLRAVSDRETDRVIQKGPPFSYEEYLTAVKSSAALYDEQKMGRRVTTHINNTMHHQEEHDPIEALDIHMANQMKRLPGASMNKDTWKTISDDGKVTWDKLSESDKKKILQYATQRADRSKLEAHTHIGEPCTDLDNTSPSDPEPTPSTMDVMHIDTHNHVLLQARNEAHPGDP
jgi:hypothetical protein